MNEITAKYVLKYMLLSLGIAGECDPASMPDPELLFEDSSCPKTTVG